MAALPRRRARRARRDDGDRGRGRRAERDGDGRRGRRPLRAVAAPPAARPGRARRGRSRGASCSRIRRRPTARSGMAAMAASTDGFVLAEKDLEIRGAGEVFGERQSGWSDLKLGRIPRDEAIVIEARRGRRGDPRRRPRSRRARAAARGGRRPPRRRRRVPLQVVSTPRASRGDLRVIAGSAAGAGSPCPGGDRCAADEGHGARGGVLRARRAWRDRRRDGARPLRRQAARSGSRRSRGRRARPCSSNATATRSARSRQPRRRSGFGARSADVVRADVGRFLAGPPPARGALRPRVRRPALRRADDEVAAARARRGRGTGLARARRDRGRRAARPASVVAARRAARTAGSARSGIRSSSFLEPAYD